MAVGKFLLCVEEWDNSPTNYRTIFVAVIDSSGTEIWHKRYNGYPYNTFYPVTDIVVTQDGNLVLLGKGLIKIDTYGTILWERILNDAFTTISVIETHNGNLMVGGQLCESDGKNCKIKLQEYDQSGNWTWSKTYYSNGAYWFGTLFNKILESPTNNFFATFFWTSASYSPVKAWAYAVNDIDPSVSTYPSSKSNAFWVRCVKD